MRFEESAQSASRRAFDDPDVQQARQARLNRFIKQRG
jgi:hypothetical protein